MFKKIVILFFILSLFFISCNRDEIKTDSTQDYILNISDVNIDEKIYETKQNWHITNKKVLVLFGYDFNSPQIVQNLTSLLQEKFGLEEDGGGVLPVTYPDSFKHSRYYVSEFTSMLTNSETDFAGVVILGAPEKTHTVLSRLQDYWQGDVPFPVIALFPQDDVLGMEANCDFVIDKVRANEDSEGIVPEEQNQFISEAPEVLIETISYIQNIDFSFERNDDLQKHVIQMYPNRKIHYFIDPETGLPSVNHFVLY